MDRDANILARLDWFTVILYGLLVFMGWLNIYAAVYNEENRSIFSFTQQYGKQLIWIGAAFGLAIMALLLDPRFYTNLSYIIYILVILLLLAVLVVGKEINGARSWFVIGGLQLQPAEFAKLSTSLALAKMMNSLSGKMTRFGSLALLLPLILLPPALIMLQPDTGSCLVYVSFFLVLFREGMPGSFLGLGAVAAFLFIAALKFDPTYVVIGILAVAFVSFFFASRHIKASLSGLVLFAILAGILVSVNIQMALHISIALILAASGCVSLLAGVIKGFLWRMPGVSWLSLSLIGALFFIFSVDFVFHRVMSDHQQRRIDIMLGIESDPLGYGYNVNQSLIAIGSGGIAGKGFLQGTQTKYNFVPEQSTDFIFCTIGEEWGFLGSSVVVGLFCVLLLRLIFLAERQRSTFSRVYGYCVVAVLFFHVLINVGMTIGLLPVIGIPLPFFSYGGSSLWAFSLMLFIMIRLDASRMEYLN